MNIQQSGYKYYLDSLKGIAIILVILYHFDFTFFNGGFIGVDIFFVISGFLITKKINDSIKLNQFSFKEFYANRIRRIFPALFFLLICILMFGYLFFDYQKFKLLGESIASISLFHSNVLFLHQYGYFEKYSYENILLHTWSLSVEEQIYFCLPLIIFLCVKVFHKNLFKVLLAITIFSFLFFCIGSFHFPDAAYYLMPSRMWEFLIGSLISFTYLNSNLKLTHLNLLSIFGFVLLVFSLYLNYLNKDYLEYSIFLTCIGTASIIISGFNNKCITNFVLNFAPLIFVGKLSFSLYLWHWPVFCLTKYIVNSELNNLQLAICSSITFILSYTSWYFIEIPFRKNLYWRGIKSNIYIFFISSSCFLFILGFFIYAFNGFPMRFPENAKLISINEQVSYLSKLQENSLIQLESSKSPIKLGDVNKTPSFVIWGDSHALGFSTCLQHVGLKNNFSGYLLSRSGTIPILDISDNIDINAKKATFNYSVYNFIKEHKEIKIIFLSARWSYYINGSYTNEEASKLEYYDLLPNSNNFVSTDVIAVGLKRTVKMLLNLDRKVVIINQVPEQKFDVASFLVKERIYKKFKKSYKNLTISRQDYLIRNKLLISVLNELSILPNVFLLKVDEILLSNENYISFFNGNPLYYDNNHLCHYGLTYVEPIFYDFFKKSELH